MNNVTHETIVTKAAVNRDIVDDTCTGYDIIGDVHGCADSLERLLRALDYQKKSNIYCHEKRKVIFIGDIIDRGPHIREALAIVYSMVESGSAYMLLGNHEINAIYYCKPKLQNLNENIRPRTARNSRIITETLRQFSGHIREWEKYLDWFLTLPLYLEFNSFRAVHACWDEKLIEEHEQSGGSGYLSPSDIEQLSDRSSLISRLVQRVTTGLDLPLPKGIVMRSFEGFERRNFRAKFWAENAKTYGDLSFQPDPLPEDAATIAISDTEKQSLVVYKHTQKPLFIGHYWLTGKPKPITSNIACLDYSAVRFGRLVAYRMDGEMTLTKEKFKWVYVDP